MSRVIDGTGAHTLPSLAYSIIEAAKGNDNVSDNQPVFVSFGNRVVIHVPKEIALRFPDGVHCKLSFRKDKQTNTKRAVLDLAHGKVKGTAAPSEGYWTYVFARSVFPQMQRHPHFGKTEAQYVWMRGKADGAGAGARFLRGRDVLQITVEPPSAKAPDPEMEARKESNMKRAREVVAEHEQRLVPTFGRFLAPEPITLEELGELRSFVRKINEFSERGVLLRIEDRKLKAGVDID